MTDENSRACPATAEPCLADDMMQGAEEIAEFVLGDRRKARRIYHIISTSNFPYFRLGSIICARKTRVRTWVEAQERKNGGQAA